MDRIVDVAPIDLANYVRHSEDSPSLIDGRQFWMFLDFEDETRDPAITETFQASWTATRTEFARKTGEEIETMIAERRARLVDQWLTHIRMQLREAGHRLIPRDGRLIRVTAPRQEA